jgi:hypothetical protein
LTSFGGGTPPSANAPPPSDGPNVQVPPVLQVQRVPEQLQSPEQPAKVEGVLPPQPSGKAAPTAIMNVTPTDSDPTDLDTFTSSVLQAGRSGVTPIAWPSDPQRDQQLACRVTAGFFSLRLWVPQDPRLAGKPATWSRVLPHVVLPSWCVEAVDAAHEGRDQVVAVLRAGASSS